MDYIYDRLIFDNLDKNKVIDFILPKYFICTNYIQNCIEILDFSDFTKEKFTDEVSINYLIRFICNNPSKFINLDINASNYTDILFYLSNRDFMFKDGKIIFESDNSLIINYNNGEKHYLRAIKEVNTTNFLYDDYVIETWYDTHDFTIFMRPDTDNEGFIISTRLEYANTCGNLMYFYKGSCKGKFLTSYEKKFNLRNNGLNNNKAESIRDTIKRGICDESLILDYYKSIKYINEVILDDFKKLHIYFPSVITDSMIGNLTRRLFLGRI